MRILIVEDEALLVLDLKHMLNRLGHDVVASVATLDEGRRQIEGGAFDLAIIDLNLKGQCASELSHLLHEKGRPFIVTTGYDANNVDGNLAASPRLGKPYDIDDLQRALRKAANGEA